MREYCPATTRKGERCWNLAEHERNGWCHIHDPNGKFRQQHPPKPKRKPSQCRARTKKGAPCTIDAGPNGWCHVHDPDGTYQQQRQAARNLRKSSPAGPHRTRS